jgi:hypothetical protein
LAQKKAPLRLTRVAWSQSSSLTDARPAGRHNTGVVDKDVHTAVFFHHPGQGLSDVGFPTHVRHPPKARKPLAGKFIGDRFYRFVNIQKGHCGALLRHVSGNSLANSPGGTGNCGDPSVKTLFINHFHLRFLPQSHRLPGRLSFKNPGIWKEIP